MNAIDYIRPRLYRAWPGAAFTFWLFAAKAIGAQLPDPLGERALVNRTPVNSRAFQWTGDVSTCSGFPCAPTAAAEIASPPISRFQFSAGGAGALGRYLRFGGWLAEQRADLRYRTVQHGDRVELASDCTAWQPVVMSRIADTLWESILPAAAGSHLVNIRIDGGSWIVPPGLVPKSDDFAGSVGVFIVE